MSRVPVHEQPTLETEETDAPRIEDDAFSDAPLPYLRYSRGRARRSWDAIRWFFLERRVTQLAVVAILLLFISTLQVPWRSWFQREVEVAGGYLGQVVHTVTRPVQERAAYYIADDFLGDHAKWLNGTDAFRNHPSGNVSVRGLTLREDTLARSSYRMDFDAQIHSRAVGWVVRAPDLDNYYAYKLVERGGASNPSYQLHRYAVLGGVRDTLEGVAELAVPSRLARQGEFNRISIRVRADQITTLVNGWGVDFWRDQRLSRGGVGFLADRGEVASIRNFTVSGNQDAWGKFLFGTIETVRSVQDAFSPQAALALHPVPPELVAHLYR